MKCEDLKQLLESNDEKNARIKANTMKCFEQVKDFVVDDFIQKSIESNFCESGHYINGWEIYRKLFEIKGLDVTDVRFYGLAMDWRDEFKFIDSTTCMYLDKDQNNELQETKDAIYSVFEYFDRNLFKNLVENHLRSCGFRNVKIKNIRGRLVETDAFYASRSTIERACCPDAKPSQAEDSEEMNSGIVFAVIIMVMVLIVASFIIF